MFPSAEWLQGTDKTPHPELEAVIKMHDVSDGRNQYQDFRDQSKENRRHVQIKNLAKFFSGRTYSPKPVGSRSAFPGSIYTTSRSKDHHTKSCFPRSHPANQLAHLPEGYQAPYPSMFEPANYLPTMYCQPNSQSHPYTPYPPEYQVQGDSTQFNTHLGYFDGRGVQSSFAKFGTTEVTKHHDDPRLLSILNTDQDVSRNQITTAVTSLSQHPSHISQNHDSNTSKEESSDEEDEDSSDDVSYEDDSSEESSGSEDDDRDSASIKSLVAAQSTATDFDEISSSRNCSGSSVQTANTTEKNGTTMELAYDENAKYVPISTLLSTSEPCGPLSRYRSLVQSKAYGNTIENNLTRFYGTIGTPRNKGKNTPMPFSSLKRTPANLDFLKTTKNR